MTLGNLIIIASLALIVAVLVHMLWQWRERRLERKWLQWLGTVLQIYHEPHITPRWSAWEHPTAEEEKNP